MASEAPCEALGLYEMNAYTTREELTLIGTDRLSHAEHYAEARGTRVGLWSGLVAWLGRRADRHRVQAELAALTERELADIGLTRGDLPALFAAGMDRHR